MPKSSATFLCRNGGPGFESRPNERQPLTVRIMKRK